MSVTLPPELDARFRRFVAMIEPLVPSRVRSLVLYGGLAKGKAFTGTSDVNVVVVLAGDELAALRAVGPALAYGRRAARVSPLLVGEHELERAMRAFPVKFYDVARHHSVLLGPDPFEGREPDRERLLENARQGLANLSISLKRLYVERFERHDLLLEGLLDLVSPAAVSFRPVLYAREPPPPDAREKIFERIAILGSLDPAPLLELVAVKKGAPAPAAEKVLAMFGALLAAVESAARAAE